MKIREFAITRYGPLPDTGRISLNNFNLFFGKNEEGKTLTIDALVKLLLGRKVRDFEHIDRVEENPEGYVILKDENGEEIKLPERGDLMKVAGFTPSECRNIFIVRNSDLSIARESEFYTNVTDRLTGLRTKDIASIKKKLQELGKLTRADSEAELSDRDEFGKMKTRVNGARGLIEKMNKLQSKIKEEKIDKLEEELVRYSQELKRTKREIENFEAARKREKYEKGKGALRELKEEEQSPEAEELRKKEQYLQILRDKRRKIDEKIRPEMSVYEMRKEETAGQETKGKFFTFVAIISPVLLGLSLLGIITVSSFLFYALSVLFAIFTVTSWIFKFQFMRNRASLAKAFAGIKSYASGLELDAENIEGIISNIQEFEKKYFSEGREVEGMKEKRRELIGIQKGILKNLFEAKGETLEENIYHWDEEIKNIQEYKGKAEDIEFDEEILSKLKEERKTHEGRLNEINWEMRRFQKDLEEIERESNRILQLEDYLHCKTSVDLDAVRNRLQEFIVENESNKNAALEAIEIFEEIEMEEKRRVSELFGKDSAVSRYFNEITAGLYKEVLFQQEIGEIQVERRDGEMLPAEKLSGGAYDQLYLSIRLALGEKLLKGREGFFIMDDPFIKADPDRLKELTRVLKKISESGWQIIYFSAKGEIIEAFKKDIDSGTINYRVI